MITYRAATGADLAHLAKHMRQQDRTEVEIGSGGSVEHALFLAWRNSDYAMVAVVAGEPVAIFGVAPQEGGGVPWLLGTDGMVKHQRALLVDARRFLDAMQGSYPLLANLTHARNTVAIRWLRWLGFTFLEPMDVNGHPFIPFYRRSLVCVSPSQSPA